MKTITVTLAEKEYIIQELPTRKNAAWRKALAEPFEALAAMLTNAAGLELNKAETLPALTDVVKATIGRVAGSVDLMTDLLFSYSPALTADKDRIMDNCYDSDLMSVFAEVLTLAYPFGQISGIIRDLAAKIGSAGPPTSPN